MFTAQPQTLRGLLVFLITLIKKTMINQPWQKSGKCRISEINVSWMVQNSVFISTNIYTNHTEVKAVRGKRRLAKGMFPTFLPFEPFEGNSFVFAPPHRMNTSVTEAKLAFKLLLSCERLNITTVYLCPSYTASYCWNPGCKALYVLTNSRIQTWHGYMIIASRFRKIWLFNFSQWSQSLQLKPMQSAVWWSRPWCIW